MPGSIEKQNELQKLHMRNKLDLKMLVSIEKQNKLQKLKMLEITKKENEDRKLRLKSKL